MNTWASNSAMRAHLSLIRVRDLLDMVLLVLLGGYTTNAQFQIDAHVIAAIAALAFAIFYTHITNDLADVEVDRINKSDRPLVTGEIKAHEARMLAYYYAAASLVVGFIAGWTPLLAAALLLAAGMLYSHRSFLLSYRGFLGTVNIVLGYFVIPFALGIALAGNGFHITQQGVLLFGSVALLGAARLLLKDFRDIAGDTARGKRTPLVVQGSRTVGYAIMLLTVVGLVVWGFFVAATFSGPYALAMDACGLLLGVLIVSAAATYTSGHTKAGHVLVVSTYVAMRLLLALLVLYFLLRGVS